MWKNHTQPQQPDTSFSCWSPVWSHSILQPPFIASQPAWLCWSLWHKQRAQVLVLQSGLLAGHLHLLHSLMGSALWGMHRHLGGHNLIPDCGDMGFALRLRLAPMITSLVFPVRKMSPHNITLPSPKDVTLPVRHSPRCSSASSPCYDPESGLTAEDKVPPHAQVVMFLTTAQMGLAVNVVMKSLLAAL